MSNFVILSSTVNIELVVRLIRIIIRRPFRSHRTSHLYAAFYYREIINGCWTRIDLVKLLYVEFKVKLCIRKMC